MFSFVLWETKGRLTNGMRNPENEKYILILRVCDWWMAFYGA